MTVYIVMFLGVRIAGVFALEASAEHWIECNVVPDDRRHYEVLSFEVQR